ncbi:hypothetical protein [Streptomyces aureus]|uniref:hypothetical protein n=1 Tax=Streptomyces aureus TaxID=193461 RepID=UPI00362B637D
MILERELIDDSDERGDVGSQPIQFVVLVGDRLFELHDLMAEVGFDVRGCSAGYLMEVLAGRRTRTEVITALRAYARAVTGHEVADPV